MDDKNEKNSAAAEKDAAEGSETPSKLECAICLQPSVQPVQLPCRHIFCYLCVKGATQQSKRCAMCRQEIPLNYLDNPHLIAVEEPPVAFEGTYQWFYEGRNGWWRYDSRTSVEIETAYKNEETQCEVLIAGYLYIIDFEQNLQYRRSEPHRRRRIKRDLVSIPIKGIAGIRVDDNEVSNPSSNDDAVLCSSSNDSSSNSKLNESKHFKSHDKKHPMQSIPTNQCSSDPKSKDPLMRAPASAASGSCGSTMCLGHNACPMSSPTVPTMNSSGMGSSACGYQDGWSGPPCPYRPQGDCRPGYNRWRCGIIDPYTGLSGPQYGHYGCGGHNNRCLCGDCGPGYNRWRSGIIDPYTGLTGPQYGHYGCDGHNNRCLCGCVRGFSGSSIHGPAATCPVPVATPDERQTGPPPPVYGTGTDNYSVTRNCSAHCTCNTQGANDNMQGTRMSRHCQGYHPYRR